MNTTLQVAIIDFMTAVQAVEFPEITSFHTHLEESDDTCTALVTVMQEKPVDTGANTCQAVKQEFDVAVLYRIGRDVTEESVKNILEMIGQKVLNAFRANRTLNGSCICLEFNETERGRVAIKSNNYRYFKFTATASFFREVS